MVETRGAARKRRSAGEVDQEEEQILAQVEAVEEMEALRIQKARKKRKETRERRYPAFEMLLPELLPRIMLFLDDSKDVYNLSKCAKYLRDAITPEIIIRSAVFAGGTTQLAMKNVMELVLGKAIWTPSPLRLLRLVNAKRCERMSECYGYNLVTGQCESLGAKSSRPWGLAICERCASGLGNGNILHYRSPLRDLDVLAKHNYTRTLAKPQFEETTSTPIGPYVLSQHVYQVVSTFRGRSEKQKEYLTKLHGELAASASEEERQKLVDIYSVAMSEYSSFHDAKMKIVRDKQEDKRAARVEQKKASVSRIYEKISGLLEGYKHKNRMLVGRYKYDGTFLLQYGPSRVILGPLLSAPSTASQKKITNAVREAKEIFELLETNGFFNGSFLDRLIAVSQHKRALFRYYESCRSSSKQLLTKGYLPMYDEMYFDSWELDRYHEVFDYTNFNRFLKEGQLWKAVFATMDGSQIETAVVNFFVRATQSLPASKSRGLARNIWKTRQYANIEEYRIAFTECVTEFNRTRRNYKDYLNHENTQRFLAETTFPEFRNIPLGHYTRQDAIDAVLGPLRYGSEQKQALANREFGRLLRIHRINFNRGYTTNH